MSRSHFRCDLGFEAAEVSVQQFVGNLHHVFPKDVGVGGRRLGLHELSQLVSTLDHRVHRLELVRSSTSEQFRGVGDSGYFGIVTSGGVKVKIQGEEPVLDVEFAVYGKVGWGWRSGNLV